MFERSPAQVHCDAQDYWGIAHRRRWWIYLAVFLCWAVVLAQVNRRLDSRILDENRESQQQELRGNAFRSTFPIKASAPSRFIFGIGGLFLGIAVGIGLAWLAELTDARIQ